MGLRDKILGKKKDVVGQSFTTFTEYTPVFTSYSGSIYEQELTRSAIDRFAVACSKLKPEAHGTALPRMQKAFTTSPNQYMTWPKFLARLATIYECDTTAYVVPAFAWDMQTITGIFPLKCEFSEIVDFHGEPWIRFHFANGDVSALELKYVCILTKYQYDSDFYGSPNVLSTTMKLIDAQAQAQSAAIKNGAAIRFIGSLTGQVREEDMKKKRERFIEDNLSNSNTSGLLLYDQTFSDVKQIDPKSYTIDSDEMERINESVYTYFGTNKDILQNSYDEDTWGAWYEGKVEPFAVQLGEGLTQMLFTQRERVNNGVTFSSNRLEYASNASKRNMIRDMLDRGVISLNEGREILQLPPVPGGDVRVIRGEYLNADSVSEAAPATDTDGSDVEEKSYDSDSEGQGDEKDADKSGA